ncbi:UDP-N-acetylglucosamine--N-acetylmuramyl-(pentapeptide) pyrophosphoryl-undecaprenol N-acetylglucosamine transferase, partial [bacterium]|nr:UDP-N-acetylglucosamine--N-acetylmuramyl-(pentapeptide) pyrophosphoryl-undecaprenol N-acetylglucosamine transferase [bacterium]
RVYLPEGMRLEGVSSGIIRNFGYPLRKEFRRIPRERARKQLSIANSDRLLVVLGGSQGASSLNKWVKSNLSELAMEGISTLCITGMGKDSSGVVQLDGPVDEMITSRFISFTDEMNVVLSAADLVVSRAGAGAIAEIVRCRVPSILVPYPYAADNHQLHNARFLEEKGGGLVCPDDKLSDKLFKEVQDMMFNEELRAILRRNLYSMDGGDVGLKLADDMSQYIQDLQTVSSTSNEDVEVYA